MTKKKGVEIFVFQTDVKFVCACLCQIRKQIARVFCLFLFFVRRYFTSFFLLSTFFLPFEFTLRLSFFTSNEHSVLGGTCGAASNLKFGESFV